MDNKMKPVFMTETWIKDWREKNSDFHNSVQERIKTLTNQGYSVEIVWLDDYGNVCQNEEQIVSSSKCKIVETNKILEEYNIFDKEAWIKEQYAIVDEMRKKNKQ